MIIILSMALIVSGFFQIIQARKILGLREEIRDKDSKVASLKAGMDDAYAMLTGEKTPDCRVLGHEWVLSPVQPLPGVIYVDKGFKFEVNIDGTLHSAQGVIVICKPGSTIVSEVLVRICKRCQVKAETGPSELPFFPKMEVEWQKNQ